jgi:hypothetical protein
MKDRGAQTLRDPSLGIAWRRIRAVKITVFLPGDYIGRPLAHGDAAALCRPAPEARVEDESEDPQDAVQRLLNDAKREELAERYGMSFSRVGDGTLSPEVEGEWLDHIAEFERRLDVAEQVTLRRLVDFPPVRHLADIPPGELEAELGRLLGHLENHDVLVDFPNPVTAAAAYRFITEDLLDEQIDDVRMPGMRMHFIFEEGGS